MLVEAFVFVQAVASSAPMLTHLFMHMVKPTLMALNLICTGALSALGRYTYTSNIHKLQILAYRRQQLNILFICLFQCAGQVHVARIIALKQASQPQESQFC